MNQTSLFYCNMTRQKNENIKNTFQITPDYPCSWNGNEKILKIFILFLIFNKKNCNM